MTNKLASELLTDPDFAALMCSRLCHDLVSPVGALSNGLELLAEEQEPEMQAQVRDLLMQSAQQTNHKLQYFRLAFGSAAAYGQMIALEEAQNVIRGLLADKKINFTAQFGAQSADKNMVRLLLNLILVVHEALIRGGDVHVEVGLPTLGSNQLRISFSGPRVILPASVREVFSAPDPAIAVDPRLVPVVLARASAQALGLGLSLHEESAHNFILTAGLA